MARAKTKISVNPLANIVAENLDRATSEISGTVAALENVPSTNSEVARERLQQALSLIAEARGLAIKTFEQDL